MFKHYTMNQVVLPLDLEVKLQENDIAFTINELVESIPDKAFEGFLRQTGRPAYHPRMMMKIILCAYTQSVFSGRKIEQFDDFVTRKQKYQKDMEIFGDRNSYSKTDHDATFMRMKDDYMRNGQLKAGYNVQIATEDQYVLAYDVFPNPTDTRTLIPFLDSIEKDFFDLPEYIVADAGYGSEQNYEDIIEYRNRTPPLITYNQYRKKKKKKQKNNAFHVDNWKYNEEEDYFLCPNGRKVQFSYHSKRTDRYGNTREFKVYECEDCSGCPLRELCTKAKEGKNRRVYRNEKWEYQKEYIRTKLSDETTGEIYGKCKIDVERAFVF